MLRLLHIVAISLLIGSAAYAYSTKYETLYYAETLTKTKRLLAKERERIAVAKAEWALLTRPDRLQKAIEKHLDLQPMTIAQLGRLQDLPAKPSKGDEIGQKLEALGLDPAPAPAAARERGPDRDRTGSITPSPARRTDEIARKLQALGLEAPKAAAKPAGGTRTAQVKPAALKPAPSKPAAGKAADAAPAAKPVAR